MPQQNADNKDFDILLASLSGATYHEISERLGVGQSRIARVLSQEGLRVVIGKLIYKNAVLSEEAMFYEKWLRRTLFIWGAISIVNLVIYFLI